MSTKTVTENLQDMLLSIQSGPQSVPMVYLEGALVRMVDAINPVPAAIVVGHGTGTISLTMSEDLYRGVDAVVAVSVDGALRGDVTISAIHAAGQGQKVKLMGDWGLGTHTVTVALANDAWGGTPTADRNAYVTGLGINGVVQPTTGLALMDSTEHSATLTSATVYSPGAAGGLITTVGNDTVSMGTGAATIDAMGPSVLVNADTAPGGGAMTFVGYAGSDTIVAGSAGVYATPGTGVLDLVMGSGNVQLGGTGREIIDITQGKAGGDLIVGGWTPGQDVIHLHGYQGTGIAGQSIGHSSSQFVLTDGTTIVVGGQRDIGAGSVFG